jgi:hypothetical protein
MQVLSSTIPNINNISMISKMNELIPQVPQLVRQQAVEVIESKIQHIILKSSAFSESDIKIYSCHGKTLCFQKVNFPYDFSNYADYDYILIDISKDKNLKYFESVYKQIPKSTEIIGIPNLIERLEYDGPSDLTHWLSYCRNIINDIPSAQVFKNELDFEHTKSIIQRSNILITSGKLLCGCLGILKK